MYLIVCTSQPNFQQFFELPCGLIYVIAYKIYSTVHWENILWKRSWIRKNIWLQKLKVSQFRKDLLLFSIASKRNKNIFVFLP